MSRPGGAIAGAVAVVLFAAGGVIAPRPPEFDSSAQEVVSFLADDRTRLQVSSAFLIVAMPFLLWFLSTVASLASPAGESARRAASLAFASGAVAAGVFLTDVAALLVGALRPESMAANPELAQALHDYSWLAPAASAPLFAAMLIAFASLSLRDGVLWPRWLGWAALCAGAAYLLRTAALFTVDGAFAADGTLGFWIPIVALQVWIFAGSLVLWRGARRGAPA